MCDKHPLVLAVRIEEHVPMDAACWFEARISPSLINQYPDVYWRMVFTYFERVFLNRTWQHGFETVAAFLDCHGLVPEEYHRVQKPTNEHRFRTQPRPRLQILYQQFAVGRNALARRPVFGPPPNHPFSLPIMLESIWDPDTLSEPSPTDPNVIQVQYGTLFGQLVDAISAFEWGYLTIRAPNRPANGVVVFEPMQVIRSRQAYYLTLYQLFRTEVNELRAMASRIAPQVQQWVALEMVRLEKSIKQQENKLKTRREYVYRGLQRFFAQSGKFRLINGIDRIRVDHELLSYLKLIGVYSSSWRERPFEDELYWDWWPERAHQLEPLEEAGAAAPAMLPSGRYPQVLEFLARMTIIAPNVTTNGLLAEFLVDSMIELAHIKERVWRVDRMQGRDLFTLAPLYPQTQPLVPFPCETIDPNQVRSQIIWLCLIQSPLNLFRAVNRLNEQIGAPFD